MELGLILTLCGLGVAFLIPAFILIFISSYKRRRCTKSTDAIVIDIKSKHSDQRVSYYPIYAYNINGVRYTGKGTAISNNTLQRNTVIPIMYNPNDPKCSYISGRDNKVYKILSIIFAAIGLVKLTVSIICLHEDADECGCKLIRLLNMVFSGKETAEKIEEVLEEDYGIPRSYATGGKR